MAAQDVLRCTQCKAVIGSEKRYGIRHSYLCTECVRKGQNHVKHSLQTGVFKYSKCPIHPAEQCKMYCWHCDIPLCTLCVVTGNHTNLGHNLLSISDVFVNSTEILQKELEELEKTLLPAYQEIASSVEYQKKALFKNSKRLKQNITKQGEYCHREIDNIVKKLKLEVEEIEGRILEVLKPQEKKLKQRIAKCQQNINQLNKSLASNDASFLSEYEYVNAEFKVVPKINISMPVYIPGSIDFKQFSKQFGVLERAKNALYSENHFLYEPRLIFTLDTDYKGLRGLHNVVCNNTGEIWTCGCESNIIRLYNIRGELMQSIQTKSGNVAEDIALTKNEYLLYADRKNASVNIVKNNEIEELIKLQNWRPWKICPSPSGDLLVIMDNVDNKQTKVVRYHGSTVKQNIQFDDKGQPLFSSSGYMKCIHENRNLDICVADPEACAVVVINQYGELRFRYTSTLSNSKASFEPVGITTDSRCRILIVEHISSLIHILDQNGNFLRYIDNCDLHSPWGLCIDSFDNIFVAECVRGTVKKIQYT